MITETQVNKMVEKILKMSKYKEVSIPPETLQSVIEMSLPLSKNIAELEKRVREKIHNIVALYLGEMDYEKAVDEFRQVKNNCQLLKEFSARALMAHASTKERGQELAEFYQVLFSRIGNMQSIADLACGLHPLGLPFMGLPSDTAYYAYDLNKARADFINIFITEQGYSGGCFHEDILTNPPPEEFDAAFFFKEAHRFEKREPGVLPNFFDSVKAHKIVVSVPLQSFGTHCEIYKKYEKIFCEYAEKRNLHLENFFHGNEVFFIIDRSSTQ
ncbi:MAG: hypothetical protein FWC32_01500 [Firmicutes bacterium]|nr:hypothetical protein [Bacillota bacterium]